ncbi:MAG TPA: HD domain-containing phosphohydrolase [Spirochaetia bacterium]|nr:HD domain-containing phosphohydrolase [Spirochaetia bacterium]
MTAETKDSVTEIFVVEDSATQAEQLTHLLEVRGFGVTVAKNGKQALELMHERKPTLVITDIVMPGMDGYELCRLIKNDEKLKDLPVLLVTSLSRPEDIFRGLECGADNFVRKPYDEKYLLSRIDYILANREFRSAEKLQVGVELTLGGRRHFINAQRQQILDLLISTYDEAVHLNEGLTRSNLILDALYRTAEALNKAGSESEVCEIAVDRAMELPGIKSVWISIQEGKDNCRTVAVRGIVADVLGPGAIEEECPCHLICHQGTNEGVRHFADCPVLKRITVGLSESDGHGSVPIWAEGKVLGILNLVGGEKGNFSDEERQTLRNIGNQVGIALERARLRHRMQSMVLERTFALTAEIEQKRIVQASQARLAAILEATTDLVAITDEHANLQFMNHAGRVLLGILESDDVSETRLSDYFAGNSANLPDAAFPIALRDGSWGGESALLSRTKGEVPVSLVILSHREPETNLIYFSAIARDIGATKQAERKIRTQVERLGALRSIDIAITSSMDLRVALNILLDQVTGRLGVDAADVLVLNKELNTLEPVASRGFLSPERAQGAVHLGAGLAGRAAHERRTVSSPDLAAEPEFTRSSMLPIEKFIGYYAVPLVAQGQTKGVLEAYHRSALVPDREWLEFLEALAGQAAIAVDVSQLFDNLQRANVELTLAYDATIEGWSHAMDLRDKETEGHTQRVTELTLRLARGQGIAGPELVHIRRGALLHDIGKMGIPDSILLKPGKLTDEEWVIMRKHPEYAFELLSSIRYLRPALDIPYCHHEKWDGSGYPRGLKGEQIPPSARLFAVIDVWDALRSDRPYRPGMTKEAVVEHIAGGAGTHFDPEAVGAFLALIKDEGQP